MTLPRVALIGTSGYGRVHLEHLVSLHERGELAFVAAVVLAPEDQPETCRRLESLGCRVLPSWDALRGSLPDLRLDLAVVPTPIHLHAPMSTALLTAGVNVLVEKPLAATVGESLAVSDAASRSGRIAAVGFQYLHAAEVQALKQRLVAGEIGRIRRIAVHAAWPRSHEYYTRNDWAGRIRTPNGWVLDSPVANAMAHFFVLLSYFAGPTVESAARATSMEAELYRAQAIESFDTAAISIHTAEGSTLQFYGTHSSKDIARPSLVIEGDEGHAEWVQDRAARLSGRGGEWIQTASAESVTRERMLRDLLARLAGHKRFICDPLLALDHVRCVDALHEYGRIIQIPKSAASRREDNGDTFTYVPGLDETLSRAFRERSTLAAAGAAWAQPPTTIDISKYAGLLDASSEPARGTAGT